MHQYTAKYQEDQHGNLQDLGGVEEPALVNLVVRHIVKDSNEIWQHEKRKNSKEPH